MVDGGIVVAAGAAVVAVAEGAVVGPVVTVVVLAPEVARSRASTTEAFFVSFVPVGTKPTVMS